MNKLIEEQTNGNGGCQTKAGQTENNDVLTCQVRAGAGRRQTLVIFSFSVFLFFRALVGANVIATHKGRGQKRAPLPPNRNVVTLKGMTVAVLQSAPSRDGPETNYCRLAAHSD